MLDSFAAIEGWALDILKDSTVSQRGLQSRKKDRHHFNHKIEQVRILAEAEPSIFESTERLTDSLQRFEGYSGLRRVLAHSILEIGQDSSGANLFIFTLRCETKETWPQRFAFSPKEMRQVATDLEKLAGDLLDQKIARPSSAS
jgi:hypothetical protein